MKYINTQNFDHAQGEKTAVLLCNLGSPDNADTPSLRRYLAQFLADPRIVEFPRLIWWLVLNLVILRFRPSRSAKSYRTVWTDEGSPLVIYTRKQAEKLQDKLSETWGEHIVVDWAMRYGNPSISSKLEKFQQQGVRRLLVLPMYPQYSATTTASTFDAIAEDFCQRRWIPDLHFITGYHKQPCFVKAIAESITRYWETHGKPDKLLFSYHGIPMRYLHNGDPYHCHCHKTTTLIAEYMGLEQHQYQTTFQSRFGREPWLQPYTDQTLKTLGKDGVKSVHVVCPGFSADCLETIEEVDEENRHYFLEAGGENFHYIPALNDSPEHIEVLSEIISPQLDLWMKGDTQEDMQQRLKKYKNHNHNLSS